MTVSHAPVSPALPNRFAIAFVDLSAKLSTNSTSDSTRSFLVLAPACLTHCLCDTESKAPPSINDLAKISLASDEL